MTWIVWMLACSTPSGDAPQAPAATEGTSHAAVLEKADSRDGEVDHVVHKCTGCGLGMDGDAAHASTVEGYELHFCSETCKANFDKDPDAGMARLGNVLGG